MRPIIQFAKPDQPNFKCAANCYDPDGTTIACICDGDNHNVGRAQALLNNQENTLDIIERWLTYNDHVSGGALWLSLPNGRSLTCYHF